MISLRLQLRDTATPALKNALAALTNRRPLLAVLGRGLEQDLRAHFAAKNQVPNKRGWPKQNFWARIRNATAFTGATNDQATVSIADPAINAHYYGGPIYPKDAKFLAIPARAEANPPAGAHAKPLGKANSYQLKFIPFLIHHFNGMFNGGKFFRLHIINIFCKRFVHHVVKIRVLLTPLLAPMRSPSEKQIPAMRPCQLGCEGRLGWEFGFGR